MISEFYKEMTGKESVIRQFFDFARGRIAEMGPDSVYNFSIGNGSEDSYSDVTIEYQLTILTPHFTPLVIELYKGEDLVISCDETYSRNDNNELVCNSPVQELLCDEDYLDDYTLRVTFDGNYDSDVYSNLIDYINLEIKAT